MGTSGPLHDELIEHARVLAGGETTRPSQADLRRAASAAYYALFHLLVAESARSLVGAGVEGQRLRFLVGKAFAHGEMVRASKAFAEGESGLPTTMREAVEGFPVPGDPCLVAEAFVSLQAERHRADYDLGGAFTRDHVMELIRVTEQAMEAWQSAREDPWARVYLHSLLLWNRIPRQ